MKSSLKEDLFFMFTPKSRTGMFVFIAKGDILLEVELEFTWKARRFGCETNFICFFYGYDGIIVLR